MLQADGIHLSPGSISKVISDLGLTEKYQRVAALEELELKSEIPKKSQEQVDFLEKYGLLSFVGQPLLEKQCIVIRKPVGSRTLLILTECSSLYTWIKLGYTGDQNELREFLDEVQSYISKITNCSFTVHAKNNYLFHGFKNRVLLMFENRINWKHPVEERPDHYVLIADVFNQQPQQGYLRNQSPSDLLRSLKET